MWTYILQKILSHNIRFPERKTFFAALLSTVVHAITTPFGGPIFSSANPTLKFILVATLGTFPLGRSISGTNTSWSTSAILKSKIMFTKQKFVCRRHSNFQSFDTQNLNSQKYSPLDGKSTPSKGFQKLTPIYKHQLQLILPLG